MRPQLPMLACLSGLYSIPSERALSIFRCFCLEPEDGASTASVYQRHPCYFTSPGRFRMVKLPFPPSHNKTAKRNEGMVINVSIGLWIQERDLYICLGRRILVLPSLPSRESRTRMSPPPRLRKRGNRVNRNPLQQFDGLLASL